MCLPRVGYYRCHPVPTTSRVDDKFCSFELAELAGLEPTMRESKSRALTTWL